MSDHDAASVDRTHEAANDTERERLRALVTGSKDATLRRPMPGDWTVASTLAHAAFWDARAIYWLDRWAQGTEPSPPQLEDPAIVEWVNDSAKPFLLALPPGDAARLALRLAEESDRKVAALSDDLLERIAAVGGAPFNLSRAEHRGEHLDDIERALGS
ncbi:MAG: DinB family protein [Candidatus Limnocylindria bacterium]